jgi:hypothetical protein
MKTDFENGQDKLQDATRAGLKDLSKAMLRLHKTLLDAAKLDYEAKNGRIANVNIYFQLVIDDPHFAWLRKISSLIALIDEAASVRRPATEAEALALLKEARLLLNFQAADNDFNDKFQIALQRNADAVLNYNDALNMAEPK